MNSAIKANLRLQRDDFVLQAEIEIPGKGVTVLCGPSGAGKSTVLRALAGLEKAQGSVIVAGEIWQDKQNFIPTHQRRCGYVFQEASLFEHLSVQKNLDYGYQRSSPENRRLHAAEIISLLALEPLLQRQTAKLSGGESKRVAIGRALLGNPQLLLMDEPLTSLDQKHRRELMPFLERLHAELDIPIVYVTHSPDEVARLGDYLVLIDKGITYAAGSVNDILTRFDLPIAYDYDASAVVETTPGNYDQDFGLTELKFSGGTLLVSGRLPDGQDRLRIRVLARDVSLTLHKQDNTSILNIVAATVSELTADGPSGTLVKLDAGGTALLARITRRSATELQLTVGKAVWAQIKSVALLGP